MLMPVPAIELSDGITDRSPLEMWRKVTPEMLQAELMDRATKLGYVAVEGEVFSLNGVLDFIIEEQRQRSRISSSGSHP